MARQPPVPRRQLPSGPVVFLFEINERYCSIGPGDILLELDEILLNGKLELRAFLNLPSEVSERFFRPNLMEVLHVMRSLVCTQIEIAR